VQFVYRKVNATFLWTVNAIQVLSLHLWYCYLILFEADSWAVTLICVLLLPFFMRVMLC